MSNCNNIPTFMVKNICLVLVLNNIIIYLKDILDFEQFIKSV